MEREEFQKRLDGLGELAKVKDHSLHVEEIRDYMKDLNLTEEQYQLVFAFLNSRQVKVEGYEGDSNAAAEAPSLTQEEESFLRHYQEELKAIPRLSEEELAALAQSVGKTGKDTDRARLIEQLLPEVLETARDFTGAGLPLGDLVQEGNIGLMLALEDLVAEGEEPDLLSALRGRIRQAIAQAVKEQCAEKEAGTLLAERLNTLSDGIKKLSDELERQVSLEELSVFLDMPVEEIEALLKLAGENDDKDGE